MSMRHPFYGGRKGETVASVGSRLPGTVKAGYGKPKLRVTDNGRPLIPASHVRAMGFDPPSHDLNAKNPRRLSNKMDHAFAEIARLDRVAKRLNRRKLAPPRLIKRPS